MKMIIDIKNQYAGLLPNVLSQIYRFRRFEGEEITAKFPDGSLKKANVVGQLNAAWNFVNQRANISRGSCNAYFKSLSRGKTLKQVIEEGSIVIHCLEPKNGHTYGDLPDADTAGRDIGVDPTLLFETNHVVACTLIHELAHIAGAPTSKSDPNAGAAEESLNHCLCVSQFRLGLLGSIEGITWHDGKLV
jgi:hypothetical protein